MSIMHGAIIDPGFLVPGSILSFDVDSRKWIPANKSAGMIVVSMPERRSRFRCLPGLVPGSSSRL